MITVSSYQNIIYQEGDGPDHFADELYQRQNGSRATAGLLKSTPHFASLATFQIFI